jgi:hypothetical protein
MPTNGRRSADGLSNQPLIGSPARSMLSVTWTALSSSMQHMIVTGGTVRLRIPP